MRFVMISALAAWCSVVLCAQQQNQESKLDGTWQTDAGGSETWVIGVHGDSIHIVHSRAGQKIAEFDCSTMGRECEVDESGKKAKVSLWFNGSTLVELQTEGQDVLKRRFTPAADGGTLEVQIIPVSPEGKTETLHLKRAAS